MKKNKNYMTYKFRFWALMTPGCISDPIFWAQHKILHQIKPKNIKIGKLFPWKWKKSQKILWQLPDGICFWGQKWKLTPFRPIPSVIQKQKSLTWKHLSKIVRSKFSFGQPWIHGRRQRDGFFFFRKNRFFFDKKS
jgi:hypothetical protein